MCLEKSFSSFCPKPLYKGGQEQRFYSNKNFLRLVSDYSLCIRF